MPVVFQLSDNFKSHFCLGKSVQESTEKRPSKRPRRRWKDNIRMVLKEIGINVSN